VGVVGDVVCLRCVGAACSIAHVSYLSYNLSTSFRQQSDSRSGATWARSMLFELAKVKKTDSGTQDCYSEAHCWCALGTSIFNATRKSLNLGMKADAPPRTSRTARSHGRCEGRSVAMCVATRAELCQGCATCRAESVDRPRDSPARTSYASSTDASMHRCRVVCVQSEVFSTEPSSSESIDGATAHHQHQAQCGEQPKKYQFIRAAGEADEPG
jgi:hypothetical protein